MCFIFTEVKSIWIIFHKVHSIIIYTYDKMGGRIIRNYLIVLLIANLILILVS